MRTRANHRGVRRGSAATFPNSGRLRVAIAAILSGAAMAGGLPAHAADNADATLEEVVVTARKHSENLQDVPESIDVFSKKDLDNLNITQFEDYATRSPSISYISIGPGYQQFFMRGVSDGSSPNVVNTSTTGMYLDEQSLSYFGGIPDLHMYDLERIEVLNGPQGTLYGASSMSGAVKLITNKPDPDAFSGGLDYDGGQIDGGERNNTVEGYVNIPLIDGTTALRVSGFYMHQGGFIDNLLKTRDWVDGAVSDNSQWAGSNYNRDTTSGGRLALLHKFNEDWKVTLSGDFQHQQTHGAWDQNPSVDGERNVARFGPESGDRYNRLASVTVDGNVGIADLVYVGGYWNRANRTVNEYSEYVQYVNTPGVTAAYVQGFACATSTDAYTGCGVPTMYTVYNDHVTRWSHELRLQSKPGGSTHWTVGAYLEQTKDEYTDFYHYPNINFQGEQATQYLDYYGGTPLPEEWYSYSARTDNHQAALFGEVTQDLGQKWSVLFGMRYFRSHDSSSSEWAGYFYEPKVPTPTQTVSFSKADFKGGLNYKYSNDTLYYVSFAQGFRDGGFNTNAANNPLVPAQYEPDTLNSYEAGWKTTFNASHLRWNGAVYYMPWKNYQTAVFDLAISPSSFNANIGSARVYGIETNVEASPIKGLTLSLSMSYNDSKITKDVYSNADFAVEPGERLPFVPLLKGTATARYEWPLGINFNAYGQFDFTHTGGMWSDLNELNREMQPGYNLSNIRWGINNAKDNYGVEAYISNLDNTRAVVYINKYNYDGRQTTNEPRVFGVRLKYRFGGKT
jgi:iron complex outermembrane receptor protein